MKTILIIMISKILIFIGKLVGRGSVKAGSVAYNMDSNIFDNIGRPKKIIAVTGSSGKGSTTKIIAEVLRNQGHKVMHNASGSNLRNGILTTLLEHCTITGKIKYDFFVMEIDERYTKILFPKLNPDYVVITNLTRDQPPRQGNVDIVFEDIKKALTPNMHLIINADDPYLQQFIDDTKKVTYFGIKKNKYSYIKNKFENLNLYYCPKCNSKLEYEFYHFEELGNYKCHSCDFKRIKPDYEVTGVDYNNNKLTINEKYEINIKMPILFSIYNIVSAFTVLSLVGMEEETMVTEINQITRDTKIFNSLSINNRKVYIFNNKNENKTTFNQTLLFLDREKTKKTIVVGWKEISRRYNFNDISWLYDVDFEILKHHNIDKVVCVGRDCYDIATRIKLSGIPKNKIINYENLEEATKYIKEKTKNDIYAILNFDYVKPFSELISKEEEA